MNLQDIFNQLQEASPFELYRLSYAIDQSLEDPDCIQTIRAKIKEGMEVDYFCSIENKLCKGVITEIRRTRVSLLNIETSTAWTVPFQALNLDHIDTKIISNKSSGMSKAELHLGMRIGFINPKDNSEKIGIVIKLNPKRAVIKIENATWAVPYKILFPIIESELGQQGYIEHQP
jgi:hypothetical protein